MTLTMGFVEPNEYRRTDVCSETLSTDTLEQTIDDEMAVYCSDLLKLMNNC